MKSFRKLGVVHLGSEFTPTANGEHPKYIQVQMGHSSIKITMDVYGHLMQVANREAADSLAHSVFSDNESGSKHLRGFR